MKLKLTSTSLCRLLAAAYAGIVLAAGVIDTFAADRTWNGGGDQSNWSDAANWGGTAPVANDSLFFGGSTGLAPYNNLSTAVYNGITFNSGAGAFSLGGNQVNLGGSVTNSSATAQDISLTLGLNGANRDFVTAGDLTVATVAGSSGKPRIVKSGVGTLTLGGTADNSYGSTTVNEGLEILAKTSSGSVHALGGDCTVNTNGTLRIAGTGGDQVFNRVGMRIDGKLQVQTNETILVLWGTNGTGIVENGLANTTNTLVLQNYNKPRGNYNGQVRDGAAGILAIDVTGGDQIVQRFSGNNTYTGPTRVYTTSAGYSRLIMDGVHTGGGDYSVYGNSAANTAYLAGSGIISASKVEVGAYGFLSPGGTFASEAGGSALSDTTAVLTFSNAVNLTDSTSTLEIQVTNTTAGSGYDQVNIAGSGTFSNNAANLKLTIGYTPSVGDKITIVKVQGTSSANNVGIFGSLNGVAMDLSQGATFVDPTSLKTFQISYRAEGSTFDAGVGNGNDIMLQVVPATALNLTWSGNGANNNWDINTTADWATNGVLTTFTNGNAVTFDDTGSNNIPVNLTTDLSPAGLTVNAAKNYVFAGAGDLAGNFVTVKTNSGTLAIVNENPNLLGDIFVKGGTLQIGTNGTTGSWAGSGVAHIDANGVVAYNRSDDITPSLNIVSAATGAGTFLKTGSGKLTITNVLTSFTGLTVNTNGGSITIGNGTDNGSIGGTVLIGSTNTLKYYFTKNMTIYNALGGTGTADYESDGNNSWTFTIPNSLTAGSTNFTGTNNVGLGIKLLTQNDGPGYQLGNGSVVKVTDGYNQLSLGRGTYNLNLVLGSTGWTTDPSAFTEYRNTLSGSITLTADTYMALNGGTVYSTISGGSYNLTIGGGGVGNAGNEVILNPTNGANVYGTTTIGTNGFVKCGNSGALSTNGLTLLTDPAISAWLDINGNTITVASLSGYGGFIGNGSSTSNATLVVGTDDTSTEFDGMFGNNGSQPLNLTKVGAGTLILTGDSTNTGVVTVNAGTLALAQYIGSGSFSNASAFAVASGATLDVNSRSDGTLTLTANQVLKHSGTSVGAINVSGNVNMGSGVLQLALNRANSPATNDSLTVSGTLTPSGTLQVVNNGPALHAGDKFQLFASGVGAGFSVSLPASDGNGYQYTWNDQVAASGYVQVLTAAPALGGNWFRTVASGNWSDASIWQRSTNGVDWVAAAIAPTYQASNIMVQVHSVTNDADVIVDQLTIQSGGAVYVAGGNFVITNGIGSDCVVTGKVEVIAGAGSVIVDPSAELNFANGGLFEWNRTVAPAIPTATWQDGSTCRVSATLLTGNATMTGMSGQSYYDFVYDTSAGGQTNTRCYLALKGTGTVIRRDFTMILPDAGGARLYMNDTNDTLLTVGRNVAWNGGSETNQGNKILLQGGTYTNFVIKVAGNVTIAGVVDGFNASSSATFEFNGTGTQTLTMPTTNLLHGDGISYLVDAGKTVALGADIVGMNTLTNLGTFTFGTHKITSGNVLALNTGGTVNGNGTNLLASGIGSMVNGGTLNLGTLPTFAGGETFTLFGAGAYSGTFGTLLPATPDGTHTWVTTQLDTAGILAVSGGAPASIVFNQISSSQIVLEWPSGWSLEVQTNSLGAGLSANPANWYPVSGATSPFTNNVNPANGTVFFRLKQ